MKREEIRSLLIDAQNLRQRMIDKMQFDDSVTVRDLASLVKKQYPELAPEGKSKHRPPSPGSLVGALQDTVHKEVGKYRAAKSVKVKKS